MSLVNIFAGLSLAGGCVVEQMDRYPGDLARVSSESFVLITMAGFVFGLGKLMVLIWEREFKCNRISWLFERVLIWIFPMFALSGFSPGYLHSVFSYLFLAFGVFFFVDVGEFLRDFIYSKLSDDEIERTFLWLHIPTNPRSELSVGVIFIIGYVLFSYFGWRIVGG